MNVRKEIGVEILDDSITFSAKSASISLPASTGLGIGIRVVLGSLGHSQER
jgi:hypothetical protein